MPKPTSTTAPEDMTHLELAITASLPIIHVRTEDLINVEEVLEYLSGGKVVRKLSLPEALKKAEDLKLPPDGQLFYTSDECKYLPTLYRAMVSSEKTIVFVNTERGSTMLEGGVLVPPKGLVLSFLEEMLDGVVEGNPKEKAEELLPAFGGLTLKDVGEVAKMTMTRDGTLNVKGINITRRGYTKLQGITQVETEQNYYVPPEELVTWLSHNASFFTAPKHPSLTPRGLLFNGPPGTGKTEAAKALASAFGVTLYRLDLGTMMGKYVGESEGNLNAALSQIDEVQPCVVIFDEVEKVFKGTGDSGVTSRMLSQLLWWLQEHKSRVFTVMTTNDMASIPVELYRPGRIDATMTFLGIANSSAGYEFAKGAFDALLVEMQAEATDADYTMLQKRVAFLYASNEPVPQVKLVEAVKTLVRECLSPEVKTEETKQPPVQEKGTVKLKISKKQ